MKIHEYQAKKILETFGVPTPKGKVCFLENEAKLAAQEIGGASWVVKAQIHAGGRGKGGGVKIAQSIDQVVSFSQEILGMRLITHQTHPKGQLVRRILVEEALPIQKEYYLGLVIDRLSQKVCIMISSEGGMEIEQVAEKNPEKIEKFFVDPEKGVSEKVARQVVERVGFPDSMLNLAVETLQKTYTCFWETDASLLEVNPLVVTDDARLIALDAKINFDSNALGRQPKLLKLRDFDEEDDLEVEASEHGLSYIALDGNIGCLVNGAGLAMATMDTIKLFGAEPANFLDVGGGATAEKVTHAFKIMLKNQNIAAILVNIFGGIMQCDVIARGIIAAVNEVRMEVPLVVRMKGTNEDLGKKILDDSGLPIISALNMAEAAKFAVEAAGGKRSCQF